MLRSLIFLSLLFTPLILADTSDTSIDVSATVTQPNDNTYCVSGICLSINSAPQGPTDEPHGDNPTQHPSSPGTVVVHKAPTCDSCEASVFVFYLQPACCPDGSVCDIAGFLSSGELEFPSDCGSTGTAAITFDACKCEFYCNNTLGHGGNPTLLPTYAPTTEAPTTEAPTTEAPTYAPTTETPTTYAPTTETPTTYAPTTEAPTTYAPTTEAPTTYAPTTYAPTTAAPTTYAPTTKAPTTYAPTTKAPTTKAPTTKAPTTKAPTTYAPTLVPTHGSNPTQVPTSAPTHGTCNRCNSTHIFFVVYPVCCTNQLISLCNNTQIANAAKHLPDNCQQDSITWDGCSCSFYCNTTSSTVVVNPNQPKGGAPVLPVPQTEIQTTNVDIHFNITTRNNTHCIAGTSICITINGASNQYHMFMFPLIMSTIMGVLSFL